MSNQYKFTPEQHELRMESLDSVPLDFAGKFRYLIKERRRMSAGADNVSVYQRNKLLGLFVVTFDEMDFNYRGPDLDLTVKPGDSNLMLELLPMPLGLRSRETMANSLGLVAKYMVKQTLDPDYVMGITYPRMAKLANRQFDFHLAHVHPHILPKFDRQTVVQSYNTFTDTGRTQPKTEVSPVIVYKNKAEFLADHLPRL